MESPQNVILCLQPLKLLQRLCLLKFELRYVLHEKLLLAIRHLGCVLVHGLRIEHLVQQLLTLSGGTQMLVSCLACSLSTLEGFSEAKGFLIAILC